MDTNVLFWLIPLTMFAWLGFGVVVAGLFILFKQKDKEPKPDDYF